MQRDIIDNYSGNELAPFLNESLAEAADQFSFATGFFNITGYVLIKDSLRAVLSDEKRQFRLIMGREVLADSKNITYESLENELSASSYDELNKNNVDDLISFLQKPNVHVRKNEDRFTHAKCYIFDKHVVVGSSNLTNYGLKKSIELNAVLYQPAHVREVKKWFERIWNNGSDFKNELIELLNSSKFGYPIEPYLMYMKFLYEFHKQRLADMQKIDDQANDLTDFQKHAVVSALRILNKHDGVIIADSTGLGKTHIGIDLLRNKVHILKKKTLLIAPKQILESVWKPRLSEEMLKVTEMSLEKTGQKSFDPSAYADKADVVMIDESHNYRTGGTARHTNLMKLLAGGKKKQVILLTATPVNNSLMDLYHQLCLITAGDNAYFSSLDIPNLSKHFRHVDKKNLMEGVDGVNNILYAVMIKRTRESIKTNYPDSQVMINGIAHKLQFPKRKLHKIEYSLTNVFGTTVYNSVTDLIKKINLVPYKIEYYNMSLSNEEKQKAIRQSMLYQTFLMKRFESSVEAIRKSIHTLEKFYEWFENTLNDNKILDSKTFRKIIKEFPDEDPYGEFSDEDLLIALQQIKNNAELLSSDHYNIKQIKLDLRDDLKKIKQVCKELDGIHAFADTKLTALKEDFAKHKVFESEPKKAVVFTSFVDTANYIAADLKRSMPQKIYLLTANTKPKDRDRIIKEFAPKANDGDVVEDTVGQILISTDVLSEGQNLQDCNYVINYDLPWNPMKIVQRVGRVDRLTSESDYVTSAIFIPEHELNSILNLLETLQIKIKKINETVGMDTTIFGERTEPKDFNAIVRIQQNDASLIDDMEKSSDMLSAETPFDDLLNFIKTVNINELKSIPLGKRSGMKSKHTGLVMLYRNTKTEDMHFAFYNYLLSKVEHIDDVGWIFSNIKCANGTELSLPFTDGESFRQIGLIIEKTKTKILNNLNVKRDVINSQDAGSKRQNLVRNIIQEAYDNGQISTEEVGKIYNILITRNLQPWDDDLADYIDHYHNTEDIHTFIKNIQTLFSKYKILDSIHTKPQTFEKSDLTLIGCLFLVGSSNMQPLLS